jgi:hypothetical protein
MFLGRPLVVLDTRFVQARYNRDSFAKIASRRRQLAFGVTLGLRGSALDLPYVKAVLEREGTIAAVCPSSLTSPSVRRVTLYTDVLPIRMALYLEPNVPDEFGGKVRRLEGLAKRVSELEQQGLEVPPEMRAELEELDQTWEMARIFRKPIGKPGYVKGDCPHAQRHVGPHFQGREGQPIPRQGDRGPTLVPLLGLRRPEESRERCQAEGRDSSSEGGGKRGGPAEGEADREESEGQIRRRAI